MDGSKVQAIFKRPRHNKISVFIISQDYYELPKPTIRANGNIYHFFKPNKIRDVKNLYEDKTSMDMTFNDFKFLSTTCWDKKYQPLILDVTKENYTGRYRLSLSSLFVPDTSPF